tara:strand:+ start:2103 stop:2738 length:636 start_codon:yes stop_codon:yes gene_type:complete
LKEDLTVSDSKRLFHKSFPYVIPAIYKRVADEILVELNLLKHQKGFEEDAFFSFGIKSIFNELTQGYNPENHLDPLFEALCKSTGFDSTLISESASITLELFKEKSFKDISKFLIVDLKEKSGHFKTNNKYYSRIIPIGIFKIISLSKDIKEIEESSTKAKTNEIMSLLKFEDSRAEKDLNNYKNSIKKLTQAIELIKETIKEGREKRGLK